MWCEKGNIGMVDLRVQVAFLAECARNSVLYSTSTVPLSRGLGVTGGMPYPGPRCTPTRTPGTPRTLPRGRGVRV